MRAALHGGFLTATDLMRAGRRLPALPTRDALLVAIALLLAAREQGIPLSILAAGLPPRFTASDRLKEFPTALSREHLGALTSGDSQNDLKAAEVLFGGRFGPVVTIDKLRGHKDKVVGQMVKGLSGMAKQRKVRTVTGTVTARRRSSASASA